MARIAVHAVVHVARYALVTTIRSGFRVALRAGKYGVVSGVSVASGADAVCAAVIGRKVGVVESGSHPRGSGVASGAGCGELG